MISQKHASPIFQLEQEFDADFYRKAHGDLASMSAEAAAAHYEEYGRTEGRVCSKGQSRLGFLNMIPETGALLEIGPGHKPAFSGDRVRYFDVQDAAGLRVRAAAIPEDPARVPDRIDYVSDSGDLSIIPETFDVVFSSHAIEHQPDLIQHLIDVERLLNPGGLYFVICPDKRYCFDHDRPESTIGDVIEAHEQLRKTHRLADVVDAHVLTTHNDSARHWLGDSPHVDIDPVLVTKAIDAYRRAQGSYIDVHAWRFSAPAFRACMGALSALNMLPLHPVRVYDTPHGSNEFCAVFART